MILIAVRSSIKLNNALSMYNQRLAEGFLNNGERVIVLLITKDYNWDEITLNGVHYTNIFKGHSRSNFKFIRGLKYYYYTYLHIWVLLLSLKRREKPSHLIHISDLNSISLNLALACQCMGIDYFINIIEHPFRSRKNFINKAAYYTTLAFAKGTICISSSLQKVIKHQNSIVVPPTVEARWLVKEPEQLDLTKQFVIGYCGTITIDKDGFGILIESIKLLPTRIKEKIKLLIIGDSQKNGRSLVDWRLWIKENQIEVEIEFTGRIDNYEVMQHILTCHLLVLTRPNNFQNRYGFPSKLPEYLSTGRPVMISGVSDIPNYLSNRISAYVIEKNTPEEASETIEFIIQNYKEAIEVGEKGFKVAQFIFSNTVQGKRLLDYFASM